MGEDMEHAYKMFEKSIVKFCLLQIQGLQLRRTGVKAPLAKGVDRVTGTRWQSRVFLVCPLTRGLRVVTVLVQATRKPASLWQEIQGSASLAQNTN
jgi:hypothetical protein